MTYKKTYNIIEIGLPTAVYKKLGKLAKQYGVTRPVMAKKIIEESVKERLPVE